MINFKEFNLIIEQIANEKGIPKEKVIETIEMAIASAYKKEYSRKNDIIRAKLDLETGSLRFSQIKIAVDQSMLKSEEEIQAEQEKQIVFKTKSFAGDEEEVGEKKIRFNPSRHIMLEEAKKIKPEAVVNDELEFPIEAEEKEEFGRIAAQTAKQVILQRLREAEREAVYEEFFGKEGKITSGIVQRLEGRNVFVDLGRALGVMPSTETIPNERYRIGERLKFYVLAIEKDIKGPRIILSRSYPKFVSKLFELEVPEIADGIVQIKSIAREPGSRTKIAVASLQEGIDPVGSCVGQKGMRVTAVLNELGQEKVDIIEWNEDMEKYVSNALSPAKVVDIEAMPKREMRVFVPEEQLSLAIGKGGQNVRLAAKLTGFKIDVRSERAPEKVIEGGTAEAEVESIEAGEIKKAEAPEAEEGKEEEKSKTDAEEKEKEKEKPKEIKFKKTKKKEKKKKK